MAFGNGPDKGKLQNFLNNSSNWTRQNGRTIGGALCLLIGFFFVTRAREVIMHMIVFMVGLALVYYGLRLMGFTHITDMIDAQIMKLRNKLR